MDIVTVDVVELDAEAILEVRILDIEPAADIAMGSRFRITVAITNLGGLPLPKGAVTLYVDASGLGVDGDAAVPTGPLEPGEAARRSWDIRADEPGLYVITAEGRTTLGLDGSALVVAAPAVTVTVVEPPAEATASDAGTESDDGGATAQEGAEAGLEGSGPDEGGAPAGGGEPAEDGAEEGDGGELVDEAIGAERGDEPAGATGRDDNSTPIGDGGEPSGVDGGADQDGASAAEGNELDDGADLSVLDIEIIDVDLIGTVQQGESFRITAAVTNVGQEALEQVEITLHFDAGGLNTDGPAIASIGPLQPGEGEQQSWDVTVGEPGLYAINADATATVADDSTATVTAPTVTVTVTQSVGSAEADGSAALNHDGGD